MRGDRGHVIGVQDRPSDYYADPPGMVYIPMGSFTMGPSDQDIAYAQNATSRTVSVPAFYMDETEITNNQYRQFVYWVRDSIARNMLFEFGGLDEYILDIDDEFGNPLDNPLSLIRMPTSAGTMKKCCKSLSMAACTGWMKESAFSAEER